MPVTAARRIQVAQQFVRFGFGEHVDENAPFYANDFLTQELTTTEVQAVLSIVPRFNAFSGVAVAGGTERFRGRIRGWKFGRAASVPILVVTLPDWSHQVEEQPLGAPLGRPVDEAEHAALVAELKETFEHQLDAQRFGPHPSWGNAYAAWWG